MRDVLAHKTSLRQKLFIEVSVHRQESEQSRMCVRDIDLVFIHDFGNVPTVWQLLFVILFDEKYASTITTNSIVL